MCGECGEDHPFDLPADLLEDMVHGRAVLFVGAGVGTELRRTMGSTLADRIRSELGKDGEGLNFPALMSAFVKKHGRAELLQRIRSRLEYIHSFPGLEADATKFVQEMATMWFIREIFTTNWDTYFEDFAAAAPIVLPEDYAFWDVAERKVFKLHGSMNNLGSLVATEEDYERCYRRLRDGPIGASLKHILATKRIVFVGYSFGDSDLTRILSFMRRSLGDVLPRSWVVTPHGYKGTEFPPERVIKTDGAHFLRVLKQAAIDAKYQLPDDRYAVCELLRWRVGDARHRSASRYGVSKYPAAVYNWAYQDGMLDALGRIAALRSSGQYSHPHALLHGKLDNYELAAKGAIRTRNYFDAAYIDGYINGMSTILLPDGVVAQTPLYFVWGSDSDMLKFKEFRKELEKSETLHPAATKKARALVKAAGGMVPVHTQYLDMDKLVAAGRPRPRKRRRTDRA